MQKLIEYRKENLQPIVDGKPLILVGIVRHDGHLWFPSEEPKEVKGQTVNLFV